MGTNEGAGYSVAERLRDIVLGSSDVAEFLEELAAYSAQGAPGIGQEPIRCAITLHRHRRPLTGAGSDESARRFDEIQQKHGEGPCLEALATGRTVVVDDTESDTRWPEYSQELHALNIRSVLAIPLLLEGGAAAAMNFFSPVVAAFSAEIIERAQRYAASAEKSLRLAVRIGSREQTAADLEEAMKSRTAIDIAVGVIMGQQRCSQEEAFALLVKASAGRNQKLRQVAENLVANLNQRPVETHFDA
ncbi:GAF and ANTAR domain-containing protein [Specibacter sp. RAF43]|uniref:GAF and ANTAR domain-containing protein n=1 Tax=Specibacter sp. RAF43 TaxID=3233057 RepID=UPI003F94411C